MRPQSHARLRRPLVLVDRGGTPPPFVPLQYSVVPHHVVARDETVASIRAAFAQSGTLGATGASAGAGAGASAGAVGDGAGAGAGAGLGLVLVLVLGLVLVLVHHTAGR